MFRNESVSRTTIMSKEEFKNVCFEFTSELDPLTGEKIYYEFGMNSFVKVDG